MKVYVVISDSYETQDGSRAEFKICKTYEKAREILLKESEWMRDPVMNIKDYSESQDEISGNNGKWGYTYSIQECEVLE